MAQGGELLLEAPPLLLNRLRRFAVRDSELFRELPALLAATLQLGLGLGQGVAAPGTDPQAHPIADLEIADSVELSPLTWLDQRSAQLDGLIALEHLNAGGHGLEPRFRLGDGLLGPPQAAHLFGGDHRQVGQGLLEPRGFRLQAVHLLLMGLELLAFTPHLL